jgi:signal transduction histidine kinase
MEEFIDFVLVLLTQFAGGPGPRENNLVRFGLPATLWAALLVVAWLRQRQNDLPREKLLVWGFALGLARELFMFSHVARQLAGAGGEESGIFLSEPLEHALTLAAVVTVAAAFLRYLLDDELLSRRYLQAGLAATVISFLGTWRWWSQHATANPEARFNQTPGGVFFFLMIAAFASIAIVLLWRQRGWLRNAVSVALAFHVVIGFLRLYNFLSLRAYAEAICPFCNSLHILSIPLFGYVYIREQSIEKQRAEDELAAYRDQLEDLVEERTGELTVANEQLHAEVGERKRAEAEIAQRNTELAAQNAIAATLSETLDLESILNKALDMVLAVVDMEAGCIFLMDPDGETLEMRARRGGIAPQRIKMADAKLSSCAGIARKAVLEFQPVVHDVCDHPPDGRSTFVLEEGLQVLIGTPLVSHGRAVGALSLASRSQVAVPPGRLDLLAGIGRQIGMVVENANLYQETQDWANELTLLHQVSVLLNSTLDPGQIYDQITEQSAKLLGCPVASVFRWDEENQQGLAVASYGLDGQRIEGMGLQLAESPILSELATRRRSIPIEDSHADARVPDAWRQALDMRALLCVPVWGAEDPLAFLFMIDQRQPRRWNTGEIELVESFVNRAAVALENAYLHKQLERAATLEERQRIAADMHDGLSQTLSYLALKAYHASELLEDGRVQEVFDEHGDMQVAIERATREVRQSISSLREAPQPRQALQQVLAGLVDELIVETRASMPLVTDLQEPLVLPPDQTAQVVRVVREALLNAVRHSNAQQISVSLEQQDDQVAIVVEDDGQGFDPHVPPEDGRDHFGLSIMRARAARIGARIKIESAPGQGARVSLAWTPGHEKPDLEWRSFQRASEGQPQAQSV